MRVHDSQAYRKMDVTRERISSHTKPKKKVCFLTKNVEKCAGKNSGEWAISRRRKKDETERATARRRQEKKGGDRKVESNDTLRF